MFDPKLFSIYFHLGDLLRGDLIQDWQGWIVRGDAVIERSDGFLRSAYFESRVRNPVKACGEVTSWTRWRST